MSSTKIFLAMILNETKCHVNTSLGFVGGASPASPLFPRLFDGRMLYTLILGE